ncbi:endo-beta-N-acetylglucosaminidase [Streptomyces telluris]|uniref:Endo-beta-N-acetylglucosaminidase n=1 Tax=Streptomyces telluris TaxID=2720021 RepID=A0A9X2RKC0_9ACTN|nr:endo-beta-N-acetylglucosaminidase [Streptomyces telluris]MCQ8769647.1 endo-beta-N-acetylglucosaminidase [Streptomyces telluris]NJP79306.1 endo-beta-N-acetylglucosaminidase [Streptomyces telluris]
MNVTRRRALAAGAGGLAAVALSGGRVTAAPAPGPAVPPALQPYASYWFPDSLPAGSPEPGVVWRSLASWEPENDPDLPFNRASVPLAARFAPPPPNGTARAGRARVCALAAFATTSGNPSQGAPTADSYALTNWAYLDELVFWGGSSGEGLILAPNAPVVDAAHRNGVPVLGTVFLPPAAYGGQLRWTRDLVRRGPDGGFPLADRLIRVARAYGFDGWFVNAETDGGDARLGADMRDFIAYLQGQGHGKGEGLRVTWYDAMAVSGGIDWQNRLNEHNAPFFQAAGSMFLNFNWDRSGLVSSAALARRLGRSPYDLWAGIDVEARGWDTPVDWDAVVPAAGPHVASYGFYRPEWTWKSLPAGGRGPAAFHARDDRFWSGQGLDPSAPEAGPWRPPAASVADRSTLTALPFATTFNTGHGLGWYEKGRRTGDSAWNHLGLQDRLPGRRWTVRTEGTRPEVGFDFADAWRGGSSLLVDGRLAGAATVELYAAQLPFPDSTVIELAQRTDPGSAAVRVELAVAVDEEPYAFLPAGTLRAGGHGWTTVTVRAGAKLRGRKGRTIRSLGIRLSPSYRWEVPPAADGSAVRWRLGGLAVRAAGPAAPARPAHPAITAARVGTDGTAELRLAWGAPAGSGRRTAPVRQYEVRQALPGGRFRFLGGTCGHAYYVPALRRTDGEAATRIEVRAVDELYTASAPAPVTFRW